MKKVLAPALLFGSIAVMLFLALTSSRAPAQNTEASVQPATSEMKINFLGTSPQRQFQAEKPVIQILP